MFEYKKMEGMECTNYALIAHTEKDARGRFKA